MVNLADFYTDRLHKHFKTLYAVWPPGKPVHLGEVGVLKDGIFVPKGSLQHYGIGFNVKADTQAAHYEFTSSDSTEVTTHIAGSGPAGGPVLVNGGLEVNFSNEKSVFFNAAGCLHHVIEDQISLGEDIMKRYEERSWDDALAVVTEVIAAGATTIVAAGGSDASVVFEATAKVPTIDLSDASLKFNVRRQKNVGLKVVSEQGLTPLIGISKVQSMGNLWNRHDEFAPRSMRALSLAGERDIAEQREVSLRHAFYFGRYASEEAPGN